MRKGQKNNKKILKDKIKGFRNLLRQRDNELRALREELEVAYIGAEQLQSLFSAYFISLCKKRGGVLRFKRCDISDILENYIVSTHNDEDYVYIEISEKLKEQNDTENAEKTGNFDGEN